MCGDIDEHSAVWRNNPLKKWDKKRVRKSCLLSPQLYLASEQFVNYPLRMKGYSLLLPTAANGATAIQSVIVISMDVT